MMQMCIVSVFKCILLFLRCIEPFIDAGVKFRLLIRTGEDFKFSVLKNVHSDRLVQRGMQHVKERFIQCTEFGDM